MSFRENKDRRTLYCGNLHENVTEELLFELFLQSGPLETVRIKRDGRRTFAFVTFKHEESVPYAEVVMENVSLYNRPLRLAARASNKDLNNNANEPYTPEIFVSDSALHRFSPSRQQGNPFVNQQQQQSLPVPLFSSNNNGGFNSNNNNNNNNLAQSPFFADDRSTARFDRRKQQQQHSYHPYNRNDQQQQHQQPPYQEYQSMKQQQRGGYQQQRRGGGGGGGYNSNYYR